MDGTNVLVFIEVSRDRIDLTAWPHETRKESGTILRVTVSSREELSSAWTVVGSLRLNRGRAEPADRVPATPPDSEPTWFADDTSWAGAAHEGFLKGVIAILFKPGTTQPNMQHAVDTVRGRVVGGTPVGTSWGYYYVQIADDGFGAQLARAINLLRTLPYVMNAGLTYRGDPGAGRSGDGLGRVPPLSFRSRPTALLEYTSKPPT